jgi:hypothetical protein
MFQNLNQTKIRNFLIIGLLMILGSAACTSAPSSAAELPYGLESSESSPTTAVVNSATDEMMLSNESSLSDDQVVLSSVSAQETLSNSAAFVTAGELSEAEIDDLLFMREEEKLARDVYLTLYDQWGLSLFQNIASSEQAHTDAIKSLLDQYGVEDPVGMNEVGVFTDPDLQNLYDELIDLGGQSMSGALRIGAAIEEIDILDLIEALDNTDRADFIRVYENLMSGSENHLRAFVSTLERQTGEIYAPQHLSQEAYDMILSSSSGNGSMGGNGNAGSQGSGGYGDTSSQGTGGQGNSGSQGKGGHGNGKGQNA